MMLISVEMPTQEKKIFSQNNLKDALICGKMVDGSFTF